MKWNCPHCNETFNFNNYQQKGAHITNCSNNPKSIKTKAKCAKASKKRMVKRFKLKTRCPTCNIILIQILTEKEYQRGEYKTYCSKSCANKIRKPSAKQKAKTSASMRLAWGRGAFDNIDYREAQASAALANIEVHRQLRLEYQERGRKKAQLADPLYIAGCMLYWGEGYKHRSSCQIVNSCPALLILFKRFLKEFFGLNQNQFSISINCYTDLRSKEEIENYWLKILELPRSALRKGQTNNVPKSSKGTKVGKSEYGTCSLRTNNVSSVQIVQEIFGAIQEYASFEEPQWLNGKVIVRAGDRD